MIITCPNCRTRYRVASDALSAAGRQVQCASCSELWYAAPGFPAASFPPADPDPTTDELAFRADDDTLFTSADEELLDRQFAEVSAPPPAPPSQPAPAAAPRPAPPEAPRPPDTAGDRARTEALARRRKGMLAALPMARRRRLVRAAVALALIGFFAAAIVLRTDIVRAVPQLDGLYRLAGLGTNVIGLDFTDVKTLGTMRDGNRVLVVGAKISNITNRLASVPPVLVSLVGEGGRVMYEWTVTPSARTLLPGDILEIDAQLTAPPQGIRTIRLSFVESRGS